MTMRRNARVRWLVASASVVAVVAVMAAAPSAGPASGASRWARVVVPVASGQDAYLNDVTVATDGSVWGIGYRVAFLPGATEFRTFGVRSSGAGVEVTTPPDVEGPPAYNQLQAIAPLPGANLVAVGFARPAGGSEVRTRVVRWNGTAWSAVTSPNPGTVRDSLWDVATVGGEMWAVGSATSTFWDEPVVMHASASGVFDTTAVTRPAGCNDHAYLTSVVALSANEQWALGTCSAGTVRSFLARGRDGSWSTIPTGLPSSVELRALVRRGAGVQALGASSGVPFVGKVGASGVTSVGTTVGSGAWSGATQTASGGVVFVGFGTVPNTSFSGPIVSARTAAGEATVKGIGPTFGYFNAATSQADGTVWAVGATSGKPLIMRRTP